jgi:hypothetical protein
MFRRLPSLERIKLSIGWHPETSLETCIDLVARSLEQRTREREGKLVSSQSSFAVSS